VNGDDETTKTKDDISKLEADFAKPAVDPNQVKNADGSFGTPDGGYSAGENFDALGSKNVSSRTFVEVVRLVVGLMCFKRRL